MIDLRSDTVTLPTKEMRDAMANAEVGDDVYGEDPTINRLEETAAETVGKEKALFVPSGTMGNQLAILTHTQRGDEIILDRNAHIAKFEVAAPAMLAGVQLQAFTDFLTYDTGTKIRNAYRVDNIHFPSSRLVCLENTFNRGGGTVMPPEKMAEAYQTAEELGLKVHLDGARIFNAAVAMGRDVKDFTASCDSVQFCLSKGLAAPVGSLLAGDKRFIDQARKYRKALGGGMRQAGVLAAAGLIALKKMVGRLQEDHANARFLAEGLSQIKGLKVNLEQIETNMVFTDTLERDAAGFAKELEKYGVLVNSVGPHALRFVTHKDVVREDIEHVLKIITEVMSDNF